jgi:PTH1 family peptidyl-tRNA hydrolase
MKLIVGLGNPGRRFQKTRHNLGFRVIDEFRKTTTHQPSGVKRGPLNKFPNFKISKKFLAEISEGSLNGEKIILAKPQTFMNNSGKAVKLLFLHFILDNSAMAEISRMFKNLWIIHDDLDLPLGKIRISIGRGSAGHKGVQSIIDELGTKNFVRFRIGIKPATSDKKQVTRIEDFVLRKFNKEEEKILKEVLKKTCQAIEVAIKEGVEKAMQEFN